MIRTMRSITSFLLAASLAAGLTACGGAAPAVKESSAAPAASAAETTATKTAAPETKAAGTAAAETSAAETAAAEASEKGEKHSVLEHLPQPGEEIHGFQVKEISDFPQKNAKIVTMDHEKSGAELLYIACDDTDKAFNVYYRTAAMSDQGIPHVFEHITLSGSGKYPNANLFDEVSSNTYNTYMNAGTWQHMTTFNMSSLSEDQLLAIMDFYMDGLTDPMALRDEHPLKRESYRYELTDPADQIHVTGAVFNEMEAANSTLDSFTQRSALKQLYPDSTMSYNSGGYRDDILTITIEELRDFHASYYHPSNMLIVMYGDMDADRFLEALDRDYLSHYDRKEVPVTDGNYVPWTGFKEAAVPYPVTEDSDEEGGSEILCAVSLGEMSPYDIELMQIVSHLLNSESSLLKKRMEKDFPTASFAAFLRQDLREPVFCFMLKDAEAGDGEKFRAAIEETMAEISRDGLNKDQIDAIVRAQELDNILSAEEPGGINDCSNFGLYWALTGDPLACLDLYRAIDRLQEEADQGTLDKMVEEYLKDPKQSVLVTAVPEPGLREKMDQEFEEKLSAMKDSMTEEEIRSMIDATEEFNAWAEKSAEESILDQVKAVNIADLPENVVTAEVKEEETDGIRCLTSEISGVPYVSSELFLDASVLDYNEIHDFMFLEELLGYLGTEEHTPEELETAMTNAMYSWDISSTVLYCGGEGTPHPYLSVSSMKMEDRAEDAWKLLEEVLYRTDFSDADRIRYLASGAVTGFVSGNGQDPSRIAAATAISAAVPERKYEYHAGYFDYLSYLRKVEKMDDNEIRQLAERLKTVLRKLLNRNGAVYTAVGSEETLETDRAAAKALTEKLDGTLLAPVDYSADLEKIVLPKSIAIAVPDSVNYSGYCASNKVTGFRDCGTDDVIMSVLYNQLLYPGFRYAIGAYGFMNSVTRQAAYMISYRDPDIRPSFEFYGSVPEAVRGLQLTQEDVNDAILNTYSGYAYPQSPLHTAQSEIYHVLQERGETYGEEQLRKMKEAKATTPEDVIHSAEKLQKMLDDGVRVTAGNSAAIRKNADLYELVIDDLTK